MNYLRENVSDLVLVAVFVFVGVGGFSLINPTDAEINPGIGGVTWRSLPFIYSVLILLHPTVLGGAIASDLSDEAPA